MLPQKQQESRIHVVARRACFFKFLFIYFWQPKSKDWRLDAENSGAAVAPEKVAIQTASWRKKTKKKKSSQRGRGTPAWRPSCRGVALPRQREGAASTRRQIAILKPALSRWSAKWSEEKERKEAEPAAGCGIADDVGLSSCDFSGVMVVHTHTLERFILEIYTFTLRQFWKIELYRLQFVGFNPNIFLAKPPSTPPFVQGNKCSQRWCRCLDTRSQSVVLEFLLYLVNWERNEIPMEVASKLPKLRWVLPFGLWKKIPNIQL